MSRILVVGKEFELQELAQQIGQQIFMADCLADAVNLTETITPDLVLFDHHFGPDFFRQFHSETHKNLINAPIIVVGSEDSYANSSSEFICAGAHSYLCDRHNYSRLQEIANQIESKLGNIDAKVNKSRYFVEDLAASTGMVGHSKAIIETLKMIKLVANSQCNPILIAGETGTGKELAARAIHSLKHPNQEFVDVNCASLTENLLESELFGHVKGAFTGADREKIGLLELAGSGTIFLDEISEIPLELQAKLLRVLQEKTFRKVGGIKNIESNATIIVSSNRNLLQEVRANRFRRDLYYRLNIVPIPIAPLRSPERKDDIELLAEYFLKTSTICPEKNNKIISLTKFSIEALQNHIWPGNVREMRNVIDRAILLETTDKIGLNSIILDPPESAQPSNSPTISQLDSFSLAKAEQELIFSALEETNWQKTKAAALLGITRATLYAKVKQYNIERDSHFTRESQRQFPTATAVLPVTVS